MLYNTTEFDISLGMNSAKGTDGKIISIWTLKNCNGRMWTEFIWLRIRASGGIL
jgi:hypothetical protein